MKKLYTYLAFIAAIATFAQAPQGFNYQATVRNSSGALIVNQNVNFKFNIMQNSPTAVPVYSETHYVPTDDLGAVNLVIGQGTPATGTFAGVNWGIGNYYMGIELNIGSGFVAMGTTQLLSVPYALYANSAGNNIKKGKTSILLTGNITNAQAAAQIAVEAGTDTENIYILRTTGMTTLDLSAITSLINLVITDNISLSTINLNNLEYTYNDFEIYSNKNLSTLSFPKLIGIYGYDMGIRNNNALTSVSLPSLSYSPDIYISTNPMLSSVNFQSFSGIENNFSRLQLDRNALPTSQINTLLNIFLKTLPASGKQINLSGQTPPAPPTGQGIIDKTTLENTGNSVSTD
ncbi:hypothetical protein [Flavobacterium sp. DSR3-2]|uniref:hypothetical protein n=1 Tax=Flavobacterium sp. DSR3-2 TaxID=2804634 RepID=UPI003CF2ED3B